MSTLYVDANFEDLKGKKLKDVLLKKHCSFNGDARDFILFKTTCNKVYILFHIRDCCEDVFIHDICGDFSDLIGSPIVQAECVINENAGLDWGEPFPPTWCFYKLATISGYVTISWHGSSNGYYSETVDFKELTEYGLKNLDNVLER